MKRNKSGTGEQLDFLNSLMPAGKKYSVPINAAMTSAQLMNQQEMIL